MYISGGEPPVSLCCVNFTVTVVESPLFELSSLCCVDFTVTVVERPLLSLCCVNFTVMVVARPLFVVSSLCCINFTVTVVELPHYDVPYYTAVELPPGGTFSTMCLNIIQQRWSSPLVLCVRVSVIFSPHIYIYHFCCCSSAIVTII